MQCKLCLQEKQKLVKKSHIIPRQFFLASSDDIAKGFGNVSNGDKACRIYSKESKSQQVQNGIHVSNILCDDCEQKIGRFDKEVQDKLLKRQYIKKSKNFWTIEKIDYKKFRLFFVSLLWRSQICNHYFFEKVKLTKDLEEKLRNMIIREDPGNDSDFSVVICRYREKELNYFSVEKRPKDFELYRFRVGLYDFMISTDYQDFPYRLTANSPLLIPILNGTKQLEEISENILSYKE